MSQEIYAEILHQVCQADSDAITGGMAGAQPITIWKASDINNEVKLSYRESVV